MSRESAEQSVNIPCIVSCFMDNCTNVCPINLLKQLFITMIGLRLKDIRSEKKTKPIV